jgi:hypothetical protein
VGHAAMGNKMNTLNAIDRYIYIYIYIYILFALRKF